VSNEAFLRTAENYDFQLGHLAKIKSVLNKEKIHRIKKMGA